MVSKEALISLFFPATHRLLFKRLSGGLDTGSVNGKETESSDDIGDQGANRSFLLETHGSDRNYLI